jgi:hypothetical protein
LPDCVKTLGDASTPFSPEPVQGQGEWIPNASVICLGSW